MTLLQMTAAELMTPNPILIAAGATLRAAALLMGQQRIHCLIVPGDAGRNVGVITSTDIVNVLANSDPTVLDRLQVKDAQTSPALTVEEGATLADCLRLMQKAGIPSVPVMRGTDPIGILSYTDVLRAAVKGPFTT
ncbi:MAG: CBS domain-containing protein [Polyangiaceae bacterium]